MGSNNSHTQPQPYQYTINQPQPHPINQQQASIHVVQSSSHVVQNQNGSLRVHPIANINKQGSHIIPSGMTTSRGYAGQEIKSKYQSPLSTLMEDKQEQRIYRTTQPATHVYRHPTGQSNSVHRYQYHQPVTNESNNNINTIRYVKTPQITITTTNNNNNMNMNMNEYNSLGGNPYKHRQEGNVAKPSSVNIVGTTKIYTSARPLDIGNVQMQKYIRNNRDQANNVQVQNGKNMNNKGLRINKKQEVKSNKLGQLESPRTKAQTCSKYYADH